MREIHAEDIAASFPRAIFGARNFAMPLEHIGGSVLIFDGFGDKSEGMINSPFLSFLFKSVNHEFVDLFFLH